MYYNMCIQEREYKWKVRVKGEYLRKLFPKGNKRMLTTKGDGMLRKMRSEIRCGTGLPPTRCALLWLIRSNRKVSYLAQMEDGTVGSFGVLHKLNNMDYFYQICFVNCFLIYISSDTLSVIMFQIETTYLFTYTLFRMEEIHLNTWVPFN